MTVAMPTELAILTIALRKANSLRLERFHEQTDGWPIMCGICDYLRAEVREAEAPACELVEECSLNA